MACRLWARFREALSDGIANLLRGTEIRKRFGLEGAQVILGHASADVTQVYAERDLQKAVEIMREVG